MDKKIAIVTGATGSIGYKIVESLLDNDYKIIALARNKTKLENLKKVSRTNIKTYSIDLRISAEIKKVFRACLRNTLQNVKNVRYSYKTEEVLYDGTTTK